MPVYARDVGLLLDRIDDPYQSELFDALRVAANERGVSLVCFVGGPPASDGELSPRSRLFELASRCDLAGAIVAAPTLGSGSAADDPARVISKLQPLPVVTVGTTLDGLPAVLFDDYDAARTLVQHLVTVHGRRRIAFVRGPEQNMEAEERYRGYVRGLFDHDLRPDESLILRGDGHRASGAVAAGVLLARALEFDALMAANDRMALGVIGELKQREIEVPGHVAVVGFDDSLEARHGSCPLTSMRRPMRQLADLALDVLLDPAARSTRMLATELVLRRSCGCNGELRVRPSLPPVRGDQEQPLLRRRAELAMAMRESACFAEHDSWPDDMFASFVSDVRGKTQHAFPTQTERLLDLAQRHGQDPTIVQRVVDVLRLGALPTLTELPGMLLRAEAALYGAGLAIAAALQSTGQRQGLSFQDAAEVVSSLAHELTLHIGLEQVGTVLERHLPRLGVNSAGLALLAASSGKLEWVWSWGNPDAHFWQRPAHGLRSPPEQPFAALALPLAFENRLLGVVTCEAGPTHGIVFEMLRALLSSAVAHIAREKR